MKNNAVRFITLILIAISVSCFAACHSRVVDSSNKQMDELSHISTQGDKDSSYTKSDIESQVAVESHQTVENQEAVEQNQAQITVPDVSNAQQILPSNSLSNSVKSDYSNDEQILLSNNLANGVQAYFSDSQRESMIVENHKMSVEYGLVANGSQYVTALKNTKGIAYVENTMDTFVRMADGSTFYASQSAKKATSNLYRIGYYYYETRYEGQDFYDLSQIEFTDAKKINHNKISSLKQMERAQEREEVLSLKTTDNTDPFVVFEMSPFSTQEYSFLEITMSVTSENTAAQVYITAGSHVSFNNDQCIGFTIIPDGQEHTYIIPLSQARDYTKSVTGLRLDIGHGVSEKQSTIKISSMKLLSAKSNMPMYLSMNRSFLVYSDKMHQTVQIAATKKTENVAQVGILTTIDTDKVEKMIVKDAKGEHSGFEGVDWSGVEYVAFDIKNAGVFGYILPFDEKGGAISVELKDGYYIIEQTKTPKNNTILPSEEKTNNANDFFMGCRVYTDETHDFRNFLREAYCERNPLNEKHFEITSKGNDSARYRGYDSLRGIYVIDTVGNQGGFNSPYFQYPNRHFETGFDLSGDDLDRTIYVMTTTTDGCLESAVILDDKLMMIPMPLEVLKNFSEAAGERNLYNIDDRTYGEVIFPLSVRANKKYEYMVAHLYQNWGNYPIKQISGIQFRAPYYHLSTGVTETNCIVPWYSTRNEPSYNTLPDFRSMSAPFWQTQPQHNSCGNHYWLSYTDNDVNTVRSENIQNVINSYGPTYAEIKTDYISADGKIAVEYTHMEMPQLDENRTYYTMEYTVLEDVNIKDFKNDFSFYSVNSNDPTGLYKEVGYLNENNQCVTVDAKMKGQTAQYVLGDKCPYFSFFNMNGAYSQTNPTGWSSTSQQGYSNVAFLIYNCSFVIDGRKCEPKFMLTDRGQTLYLSLDLDKVTLKKGDHFTINAVLLPWGSQELDNQYDKDGKLLTDKIYYDTVIDTATGEKYKDKNVRNVRENTLLNPLKVTAVANCKTIDSVYLPKVRTTNGKSAEFTLSGGMDNVAVRVYGFEKLTAPKVYEKIDGEWKQIELYSANNHDKMGFAYYYDGYGVHYDDDGTFSYSFVTTMDGKKSRTFKIEAFEDFQCWPEIQMQDQFDNAPLDIYYSAKDLEIPIKGSGHAGDVEYIEQIGESFLRVYAKSERTESYVTPYIRINETKVSGQYIVFKYRIPTTNTKQSYLEFFVSTQNQKPTAGDNFVLSNNASDGEWKVVVIDVSEKSLPTFKPNDNNEYCATYLRLDYFNGAFAKTDYIDIAYIGMCDTIEEICALNFDMKSIRFVGLGEKTLDPNTKEISTIQFYGANGTVTVNTTHN